ncbi:helix-turn-helix transcriptional regulator [Azospirillum melinis]|uniref:helix-turn-helix transcriptional regulator n=1 Tax=Azospirillum melinis TaxID=328839 RepID=UPI003756D6F5
MLGLRYAVDMNGKLIAAARTLLGWSQDQLAEKAEVSRRTVISLETDKGDPKRSTEKKVVDTLKAQGIEFTEMPDKIGVAIRRDAE